ncbi:chemotaxis protein CheW [Imhoffiella purpurea]|uniref:Twitching motility protein n=1 Tax=Imhoffiella purpurea TaxID=1249627 RepID=W9V597_9GAMM|nr:chemotaxis protein CheW [Imhoffiella purpurea]EXJ14499.1 twitching motility protein [Imhoffiella purpurea]
MTTQELSVSGEMAASSSAPDPARVTDWMPPSEALNRFQPLGNVLLARADAQQADDRYGFRISSLGLMVQPRTLTELIPMTPIVAIPNGPSWLCGMINVRSQLVPVFDLSMMCGLPSPEDQPGGWILVLDAGERAVGLVVAEYPKRLRDLRPVTQLPSLPDPLQRAVSAGYLEGDTLWLELDHRAFFSSFTDPGMDASP